MSKKSRFRISLFWPILVLFALGYILFWVIFINGTIVKDLNIYNESLASVVMDKKVAEIAAGDISFMDFASSASRFEDGNIYRDTFAANIKGKTITYKENDKSYDAKAPLYDIYAGDELIANAKIVEVSSEPLMMILSKAEWKVEYITPIYETGDEGLVIEVPDMYTVYVNGIQVDERELTGTSDYSDFEYAAEYVSVPHKNRYEITGLMTKPTVKVCNPAGAEVAVTEENAKYTAGFTPSAVPSEISEMALKNAKTYSNFLSTDLPGCRDSIKGIKYMFPEDSVYLTYAENYRLHDMWMYSGHAAPVFSNESVTDYYEYSDSFFQVNVYFDKSMKLTRTGDTRVDTTNTTFYYVKINGEWVIADMISIIAE